MADIRVALKRRQTRLKRLIQLYADAEAKRRNDPLYRLLKKTWRRLRLVKKMIRLKYEPIVRAKALATLNKHSRK